MISMTFDRFPSCGCVFEALSRITFMGLGSYSTGYHLSRVLPRSLSRPPPFPKTASVRIEGCKSDKTGVVTIVPDRWADRLSI